MRFVIPLLLLVHLVPASAAERIAAIRFEGNRVTRESVCLREMTLDVGDEASAGALAANRQAILDLGLFRDVAVTTEPVPDGVTLVVRVREKRYILPLPRIDTSSDADVSYGGQLRWDNVLGLNHRFDVYYERGDYPNERDRSDEQAALIEYQVPYFGASRYGLRASAGRIERGVPAGSGLPGATGAFDEEIERAEVVLLHDYAEGRPRTGWTFGTGLLHRDQATSGLGAPPPDGRALALVGIADYNDFRFNVHSETGRRFYARVEAAGDDFGSDYDYSQWTATYFDYRPLGTRAHQTLHFIAAGGFVTDGPRSRNAFSLGGSGRLRGYETDFVEGDRFYYGAIEYLRPLKWDWLRLLAVAELGGADDDVRGLANGSPQASIGLGVRIRLTMFVDVEIELGVAYPLRGGGGARFFAGGN
jgi:outer membrane protein assembly factor BamA